MGATFAGRGSACSGASTSCTVTLNPTSLVTATFSKIFTDATVSAGSTVVQALHVTELQAAIDTLQSRHGLLAFEWIDPTVAPGATVLRRVHFTDLRTALTQAFQAGQTAPTFTDGTITPGVTVIKAIHLKELRGAVRTLE